MALTGLTNLQPLHIKTVGIGTFDNAVSIGGTLTYEDVTNVDAIGIITARSGINVSGGQLDVGSNIKLGNAGVITATSFVGSGSGLTGLNSDLVNDSSPQLGGALDVNGNNIQSGNAIFQIVLNQRHKFYSSGNQIIDINGNGVDFLHGNNTHADSVESRFGTHNDLKIWHESNNSIFSHNGTGDLLINTADGEKIYIDTSEVVFRNASSNETLIKATQNSAVELYHNNSKKLDTVTTGIRVHGDEGGTAQLQLLADQGDDNADYWRFIAETNGTLNIQDYGSGNWYNNIRCTGHTGGVMLYQNNSEKFSTQADGVSIYNELSVGTASVQSASVASFVGGAYNQVNIADGSNSGWGLLLAQQQGTNNSSLYTYSTNSSTNKPCSVVNVNNDCIHFATNNTPRFRIEHDGHVIPSSNGSYDLGSSNYRWRNIYTADLQLSNKGKANDVDNTWGDYTIQEGESDLFLINNRSGKKYKFNLTEVS